MFQALDQSWLKALTTAKIASQELFDDGLVFAGCCYIVYTVLCFTSCVCAKPTLRHWDANQT